MPKFYLSQFMQDGRLHFQVMGAGGPWTRAFSDTLSESLGKPRDHTLLCAARIVAAMTPQQRQDAGVSGGFIPVWDGDAGLWLEPASLPVADRAWQAGIFGL